MHAWRKDQPAAVDALLSVLDSEPALQDALPRLVESIGVAFGWEIASIWLVDRRAALLRFGAMWAEEPEEVKEFERASRACAYLEGEGLPGRAWRSRVPIWAQPNEEDPRLDSLRSLSGQATASAIPLVADDRVVAVVELASRTPSEIDHEAERRLLATGAEVGTALDRRMTEEAAGAERARLEVALAAGRMGVWDWDLESNRLRWSASLEGMMGLAPGAFGGAVEDYLELVHADDRDWVLESYLAQFEHQGDQHIHLEHRFVRPDGEVRWLQIRGRALRGPSGELATMTGVALDVTERVEREQRTRVQRAQLDLAMEVGALGAWEFDRYRQLGRWSDSIVDMVGHEVDPEAITIDDITAALHPDDRGTVDVMIQAAFEGADYHARYRIVRPDGEVRWLESWGQPLHDVGGEILGMAGITIDITPLHPQEGSG
ncbi:MAG: PAS domain-containing protein [Actinobacteria bacterium]|nr:PAS domain-containing protein [Actinomycetota bacterium]